VKKFSVAPFYGRHLALPTNIRPGWKGLPGTNTLAYYKFSYTSDVKNIITLGQGTLLMVVVSSIQ